MNRFLLIILPLSLAFSVCSCQKDIPGLSREDAVSFSIQGRDTKALLDHSDFLYTGTQVAVYDLLSGATVKPSCRYIDGDILTCPATGANTDWTLAGGMDANHNFYVWPATGKQVFWGYLKYDAKSGLGPEDLFGSGAPTVTTDASFTSATLDVPSTTITAGSAQFDFCYSDVDYRPDPDDHNVVDLQLRHLLSAFAFNVTNNSSNAVEITSLKVMNVKSTNSASISFSSAGAIPSYGTGTRTTSTDGWVKIASDIEVPAGSSKYDIFGTPSATPTPRYYLMWPHNVADFATVTTSDSDLKGTLDDDNLMYIYLKFNQGAVENIERLLAFPRKAMEAGTKYLYTITFADKIVQMTVTASPWDYLASDVNYSDGTVTASTVAAYEVGGSNKEFKLYYDYDRGYDGSLPGQSYVDDEAKTITVRNGMPIKVKFNLQTPEGAEWLVSLYGDRYAFNIEKLTDNVIDGTDCCFQLVPNTTGEYASPSRNYSVRIRVALRLPNGRVISADPVLQGYDKATDTYSDQYVVILPKA